MKCCICKGEIEHKTTADGKVYWKNGENAQPIMEGRCCVGCNETVVIPERIKRLTKC